VAVVILTGLVGLLFPEYFHTCDQNPYKRHENPDSLNTVLAFALERLTFAVANGCRKRQAMFLSGSDHSRVTGRTLLPLCLRAACGAAHHDSRAVQKCVVDGMQPPSCS
jgi:hypothetical protein